MLITRPIDPTRTDSGRFWSRVDVGDPSECWEWTASRFSDGYGQVWFHGSNHPAHRLAWALGNTATLLPGWLIRHDCDNPPCCNPNHLRPGTVAENAADMVARGRTVRGRPAPKPTGSDSPGWRELCRRGHDPRFRYTTGSGVRRCRACDRLAARAGYHRRKAASC